MQKITPFLFDNQAEMAVKFYVSIFKAMTVDFGLDRKEFVALNGGPRFDRLFP
jgi:predicted 3-demethylubiquinone-9 3-methyltransferase (glyoxalase superfamily)